MNITIRYSVRSEEGRISARTKEDFLDCARSGDIVALDFVSDGLKIMLDLYNGMLDQCPQASIFPEHRFLELTEGTRDLEAMKERT